MWVLQAILIVAKLIGFEISACKNFDHINYFSDVSWWIVFVPTYLGVLRLALFPKLINFLSNCGIDFD